MTQIVNKYKINDDCIIYRLKTINCKKIEEKKTDRKTDLSLSRSYNDHQLKKNCGDVRIKKQRNNKIAQIELKNPAQRTNHTSKILQSFVIENDYLV